MSRTRTKPTKVIQWIEPSSRGAVLATLHAGQTEPTRVLVADLVAKATGAKWYLTIGFPLGMLVPHATPPSMPEWYDPSDPPVKP